MTFQKIINEVQDNITKILNNLECDVSFSVTPAKSGFGDVSCNVSFLLAKHLKKSPKDIAEIILSKYEKEPSVFVDKVIHESGYLNFFADWKKLSKIILSESLKEFDFVNVGNYSVITIEHTSVNPNKALHIGHVRNIIIGDILSRILKKANYKVNVLNYIDDFGLQVADIVIGFKHLGFSEEPPNDKKFDHYCGDDVYVKTTAQYANNPNLEDTRKKILQEIEDGKSQTAQFAEKITKRVLSCQLETCWNLGIRYDCLNFESQIIRSGLWSIIFEKLKSMKLIHYEKEGKNAGCWVIRGKDDDKVIVRSNGTATYIAKDIPYAAWKLGLIDDPFGYVSYGEQPDGSTLWQTTLEGTEKKNFVGDKVITVIDSRQTLLQNIITELMSKFESNSYVHLGYESVTLSPDTAKTLGMNTEKQTQMSGRKGLYVNADSVYDLLKNKIISETTIRHPKMNESEIAEIAHHIAVGTLRYEMIKQDLDKIITFDLTKSLSLEGDTASYIQYTHARASRIIEKSSHNFLTADSSLLCTDTEIELIKIIGMFDIQIRDAAKNLSPKVIARYCYNLATTFNEFYEKIRVLNIDNERLENSRLYLVNSFKVTLEKALDLLGISAPEKM